MGSKLWFSLALLCYTLCGISACFKLEPLTITPKVARVVAISPRGLDLDVEVQVTNPNSIPLVVESVTGQIFTPDGLRIGRGNATPAHTIAANASSSVVSRVQIDWDDLSAVVSLVSQESIPYNLRGSITFGGKKVHLTLPFSLDGQLTRAQLLQAGVLGLKGERPAPIPSARSRR